MDKDGNTLPEPLPTWLNVNFLQKALQAGYNEPNLSIIKCNISSAIGKGENFLGLLYRAAVLTSDGHQHSLILKCFPSDEQKEAFIKLADLFDIEIEMYTKTLPKIHEILNGKCPSIKPFTAKFIYSNPEGTVIVLEDLFKSGFTMAKRQKGLDLKHCELVLKSLAAFHAASAVLYTKDFSFMTTYLEGLFKERTREFLDVYFTSSIQSLIKELQNWPNFKDQYTNKLENLIETWWEKIGPALSYDEDGFNVLNHGDLWINNMMFSYSSAGNDVEKVKFVDLQNVHFTSPAIDLLYFFYTSPSDEVRQKYFDHLIEIYHDSLKSILMKLGYSEKIPTIEEIHQQLKKRMSLALFAIICELPNMLAEQEDVFDIGDYFKEGEDGTPKNKTYSGTEYKRVVQRLLPVFVESGIL